GDSFTFGDQVADDQTWPAYLEEVIGCRVANGGVFGYGFDQIVLRAEELTTILKPDVLIVSLIEDDVNRCELSLRTGWPKPYFEPVGEGLVLRNVPTPRPPGERELFRRLGGYSLLVHLMMTRINPEYWLYGLEDAVNRATRVHDQGFEVACRLMSRLAELKERRNLKAIVLFQYPKDLERGLFRDLAGCVAQNKLELVDLYQPLKKIRLENHQEYEAMFTKGHMRPPGNRFVAEVLAQVLIPVLSEVRSPEEAN
ncbi:MAG: hypothetical protein JRC92_04100, partial [Deltaproteobacteria bacterium]|nr:hypothetical protein [Deltaproteobacteria bacterium]